MYAVIFRAKIAELDEEYMELTGHLRDLAIREYGCKEFTAVTEGDEEIAISYWSSLQQIKDWKNDPEHQQAQKKGRARWYKSVNVQICEIIRH